MPEPIKPHPRTPMFLISIRNPFTTGDTEVHMGNLAFPCVPLCPLWLSSLPPAEKNSLKALHHHSNPLPAADARRWQPVLLLSPPQLIQQRDHEARPGRSQRMPQRNRSAVHVHFFAIESQFFLHRQILRRERLVHFTQIDVV